MSATKSINALLMFRIECEIYAYTIAMLFVMEMFKKVNENTNFIDLNWRVPSEIVFKFGLSSWVQNFGQ